MDRPSLVVTASAWQYLIGIVWILEFIRSFVFVWLAQEFLYSDVAQFITPLCVVLGVYWSPLNLFKSNRHIFWTIWGLLTCLWTPLFWIFPLILFIACLVFNSVYLGMLTTLFLMGVPLVFGPDPFIHVPVVLGLFIITFFLFSKPIFKHFETQPITLLDSFKQRE